MNDARGSMMHVSIDSIVVGRRNLMRRGRDECIDEAQAFEDLCESVRAKGILQPVVVRKLNDNKYQLIAGYRRVEAARTVGSEQIPVIIQAEGEEDEKDDNEIQFIENLVRKDVCPVKRGQELHSHIQKFYGGNTSEFARKLGIRSQTLSKWLRITRLSERHRDAVTNERLAYSTAIEAAGTMWSDFRDGLHVDDVLDAVIEFDITRNELRQIRELLEGGDDRTLQTLILALRGVDVPQGTDDREEVDSTVEVSVPEQQNLEEQVIAELEGFWKGIRLHARRIHEEVVNAIPLVADERKEVLFRELQDTYRELKSLAQQCFSDRWEELIASISAEEIDVYEDHDE